MTALKVVTRMDALVEEVIARVPQPVDTLEIAAVLESMGITDAVAIEDYGATSSFQLAERVIVLVRRRRWATPADAGRAGRRARLEGEEPPGRVDATARSLVSLAPLTLLVVSTQGLARAGWEAGWILALSLGVMSSMLLTMGPVVAMGRRASLLIGYRYRAAAYRYLTIGSALTIAGCAASAGACVWAAQRFAAFETDEIMLFAVSLTAFAVVWLPTVCLTLLGRSHAAAAVLASGVAVGALVARANGATAGVVAAYLVIVLGLALAWASIWPRTQDPRPRTPRGVAALEMAPYLVAGTLFAVLIAVPHPLGWFGEGGRGVLDRLTTFELSLLLALVPLFVAAWIGDTILRSFWLLAADLRDEGSADGFRRAVRRYVLTGLARYAILLAALTAATIATVEAALHAGRLDDFSRPVFLCGLVAFGMIGIGQYWTAFMLGLALPGRATLALVAGITVLASAGPPLSRIDYRLAAAAFAAAALVFAVVATVACLRVLRESPRRYSTAF
jgi:hypothetical protein